MAVYNFTNGSTDKPISWWYFEEAATPFTDGNTTNANDLAWGAGTTRNTTIFKQGASSAKVLTDNNANWPLRAFASLTNMPFKAATTAFTIGGWINITTLCANFVVVGFFTPATCGWHFAMNAGATRITANIVNDNTITNDANLSAATWYHIVMRWNGDNRSGAGANDEVSLWVNGSKQTGTFTSTSVTLNAANDLVFHGDLTNGFGGLYFDEWAIFNTALLDDQIASWYAYGLAGPLGASTLLSSRRRRV